MRKVLRINEVTFGVAFIVNRLHMRLDIPDNRLTITVPIIYSHVDGLKWIH
jgi:hypothetical protein